MPTTRVIAYGDSLVADESLTFDQKWCGVRTAPELDCEPRGISGEKTVPGVARLLADLEDPDVHFDADFVVLGWGANDLRKGDWDGEALILSPISQAADALEARGLSTVFWVPNPQFRTAGTQDEIHARVLERIEDVVRPGIQDVAAAYGAPVIDLWELFPVETADFPVIYEDHVHPADAGNDLIADLVAVTLPEPGAALSLVLAMVSVLAVVAARRGC